MAHSRKKSNNERCRFSRCDCSLNNGNGVYLVPTTVVHSHHSHSHIYYSIYVHVLVLHCTAQASSQSLHQATRMVGTMPAVRVLATSFITAANPPSSFVWRRRASQAIAGVCFVIATLLITL